MIRHSPVIKTDRMRVDAGGAGEQTYFFVACGRPSSFSLCFVKVAIVWPEGNSTVELPRRLAILRVEEEVESKRKGDVQTEWSESKALVRGSAQVISFLARFGPILLKSDLSAQIWGLFARWLAARVRCPLLPLS